jgi:hypothetical protein
MFVKFSQVSTQIGRFLFQGDSRLTSRNKSYGGSPTVRNFPFNLKIKYMSRSALYFYKKNTFCDSRNKSKHGNLVTTQRLV